MNFLADHIAGSPGGSLGTALIIGAGSGDELPDLRVAGFTQIVLVEAHPGLADLLNQRLDPSRRERALALAATTHSTPNVTLHEFNNPRFSSLSPAEALAASYPNLKEVRQIQVPAKSLGEIIASLHLDPARAHLLRVDAPGQAHALLQCLAVEQLQLFTWVSVAGAEIPLYADEQPIGACTRLLAQAGFATCATNLDAIAPQASILARNDNSSQRAQSVRNRVARVQAGRYSQLQTLRRHAEALKAQVETLTAERNQQEQRAQQRELEANEASAKARQQAEALKAQVETLTAERDQQAKLAQQRELEANEAFAKARQQAEALKAQVETLTAERDRLIADARTSLEDLRASNQSLGLSVQLQTLREADLKDLQQRYGELRAQYTEQQALLKRVTERLTMAARYFRQLTEADRSPQEEEQNQDRPRLQTSNASPSNKAPTGRQQ